MYFKLHRLLLNSLFAVQNYLIFRQKRFRKTALGHETRGFIGLKDFGFNSIITKLSFMPSKSKGPNFSTETRTF